MNFCTNCGAKLAPGMKFCGSCGSPVAAENEIGSEKIMKQGVKCPNCGLMIDSFSTNCPACGTEIRGIKASSSIQELSKKLEELETQRPKKKLGLFFSRLSDQNLSALDETKASIIKNFPIPNTKEDILEFMIMASSSINYSIYGSVFSQNVASATAADRAINEAWISKLEQTYNKGILSCEPNSPELLRIQEIYRSHGEKLKKQKLSRLMSWLIPVLVIVIFYILLFAFL